MDVVEETAPHMYNLASPEKLRGYTNGKEEGIRHLRKEIYVLAVEVMAERNSKIFYFL